MNSFRSSITESQAATGPQMPVKRPSRAPGGEGLTAVPVPRSEGRTHNQRNNERDMLTGEQARLFVGRKCHVVDLLNLSGGGAMIGTDLPLGLWQRVELEPGGTDRVECAVRWIKGERVGLEFALETRIEADPGKRDALLLDTIERNFPDVAVADDAPAERQGEPKSNRSTERHPLIWSGEIHYDYESTPVRLRNISESGALVDCLKSIPAGAELLLDLGGAGQLFATVSWARGNQLGLRFDCNFDIARLAKSQPQVATNRWLCPDYLDPAKSAAAGKQWQHLSLPELKQTLDGFLKR